jgi:hypothetical protein
MLDFLGIGAQKAGTSWLHRMLALHPQIAFPAGKEVHFWDAGRALGTSWYEDRFAASSPGVRQGEITPAYALLDIDSVREIHAINPALRVLFILRNPLERAWSSALMALRRAELKPHEASDQWFLDHFHSAGSRGRGDYETTIRRWREVFDPPQLLLLRFEQIKEDPRGMLASCADHLSVDRGVVMDLPDEVLAGRVFSGPGIAIRPSLVGSLQDLYSDRITALQRLLGWDLQNWIDYPPA